MRALKCLRCAARMTFMKREKIQLGQSGAIFGDWPNILAGALDTEIYCCPQCGKLEFFLPQQHLAEEEEEVEFQPVDVDQNIVGVSTDGVPQIKCPRCGRTHDFDYPKCIYCDFQY